MGNMENRITEADLVDFVRHCQDRYFDHGITPTEKAHSPLPKCMGGTDIVLLTKGDHAKHDVLQTECYGEGTLTPFYFKELVGTSWEQRAKEALSVRQSQSGKIAGKIAVESGQLASVSGKGNKSIGGKIGGKVQGKRNVESGQLESIRTPESCSKGAKSTNSQRWMCTISKRVSTSGPLTIIQKSLGIDPSNRIKIS